MKYVTFSLSTDTEPRLGCVHGDAVVDVSAVAAAAWSGPFPATLWDLIQSGPDAWHRVAALLREASASLSAAPVRFPLKDVRCHAPIPRPRKNIVCLGQNYLKHLLEAAKARQREVVIPTVPVFFTKTPTTVNGPYDDVAWDRNLTAQLDYEAELGAIVGVGGKNIPRAEALGHVFGYTVINDISARDVQLRHGQWFKGKSLDGTCPMGPYVVTADELGDPQNKRIALRVNGVVKQDSNTSDMIFPLDVILESLSQGMTLEPGDIIATGTPEGVGLGRTPPEYLQDGDIVETEIEGIGTLRNRIVAFPAS